MRIRTLPGRRFGKLVILEGVDRLRVKVRCDCGTEKLVHRSNLLAGKTASCARGLCHRSTIHGHATTRGRTPEFQAWTNILARCHGRHPDPRYVARGIVVCERWRKGFEAFLADVGLRPSAKHSLDRINNDGNHEPGNWRWATRKEQMRNVRTNLMVQYQGRQMAFAQACEESGVNRMAAYSRMTRWGCSFEEAIARPIASRKAAA